MFIEDLAPHPTVKWKSVGYLDGNFAVGIVPMGFLHSLKKLNVESMPSFGKHICPYCSGAESGYEFMAGGYIWPEMLAHYIEVHHYKPPTEFVEFVINFVPEKTKKKRHKPAKLPDFDF